MKTTRRRFLKKTTAGGVALGLYGLASTSDGCKKRGGTKTVQKHKQCMVLGIDGLDRQIMDELIKDGRLPDFTRLANQGTFAPLRTSNPAISPVAWSDIASGAGPGHHGIFDFLHRDPGSYMPYLSVRRSSTGVFGTRYKRARLCEGLWRYTSDAGIATTVIRWPVTFPAERVTGRFLSGLGAPDLLGSEGQYSYYTTQAGSADDPSPQNVVRVSWQAPDTIGTFLEGPMISRIESAKVPLVIKKMSSDSVSIDVAKAPIVEARRGRWTRWIKIAFKVGMRRIPGMVRFLLMQCEPDLKLFVYPVSIDPANQVFAITYPQTFGRQLEQAIGTFHTLGMPEMIHPLSHKRYGFAEFLAQTNIVSKERTKMFEQELDRFDKGLLAFVFDHTDRIQHALWSTTDEQHPIYREREAKLHGEVICETYRQMDSLVGKALEKADDDTLLMVISDHGFGSFRRQVHVNRWLIENGYMHLKGTDKREGAGLFGDVDWTKTRAYAVGFASIYVNLAGREGGGIVKGGAQYTELCTQLARRLKRLFDGETSRPVVHEVYQARQLYNGGPAAGEGPDLLVGLKPGYRFSWQTALGAAPTRLIEDNTTRWSGDHIFDPGFMPGVLLSNKRFETTNPRGVDIAPTVLSFLGLNVPDHMTGRPLI
jgi:predicted AlkP superfamily phosphohydrolase/phosphomutase